MTKDPKGSTVSELNFWCLIYTESSWCLSCHHLADLEPENGLCYLVPYCAHGPLLVLALRSFCFLTSFTASQVTALPSEMFFSLTAVATLEEPGEYLLVHWRMGYQVKLPSVDSHRPLIDMQVKSSSCSEIAFVIKPCDCPISRPKLFDN